MGSNPTGGTLMISDLQIFLIVVFLTIGKPGALMSPLKNRLAADFLSALRQSRNRGGNGIGARVGSLELEISETEP